MNRMPPSPCQHSVAPGRRKAPAFGFTLVELLVGMGVIAVLATVALASSNGSNEQVLRAQCADHLRRIGVGLTVHAAESNDFMPVCKFRNQNCWYTYEVGRIDPGGTYWQGPHNLGPLHKSGAVPNAKIFYCPSAKKYGGAWTYETYAIDAAWPFGQPTSDPTYNGGIVRAGYAYFPQARVEELLGLGVFAPKIVADPESSVSYLVPLKTSELNVARSITTDLVHSLNDPAASPHRSYGAVDGLNALFPDGHVAFQIGRSNPDLFNPQLWEGIGSDGFKFRRLMSLWKP